MTGRWILVVGVLLQALCWQAGFAADMATLSGADVFGHNSRFAPANGEKDAYPDALLSIRFDQAPALGASGKINVYRTADAVLVDSIDISDALTARETPLGHPSIAGRRSVGVHSQSGLDRPLGRWLSKLSERESDLERI